ncbi:hypothetical protein KCP75_16770 [Salmonella enterica subsp. enterica]|nr:hypothetical protein KCP75_16770 [Salmonella enterica subsp. enterica]
MVELSADGKYRIVVGQEWDYTREDMALAIVAAQLTRKMADRPARFMLRFYYSCFTARNGAVEKNWRRRCASDRRNPETPLDAKRRRRGFAHWSKQQSAQPHPLHDGARTAIASDAARCAARWPLKLHKPGESSRRATRLRYRVIKALTQLPCEGIVAPRLVDPATDIIASRLTAV